MAEIDDLYLLLRAQTAPLTEGFLTAGTAGEELAAKLAASMNEITASVDRMAENARIAGGSIDEMATKSAYDMEKLALATQEASLKMEAAQARAAESNKALGETMAASSNKVSRFTPVAAAGAAAFAFIGYEAVKAAGNFESATTRLVTSAGEIQSNLDMVRKGMLDMAGQVGTSADDLAKAMYTIESGGQHGADGLKVLKAAAQGAKTENADLTTVADAVTSVLQDYHLKASDAATVTSKLVAAVGAGKTTFQELTGSLHSVLPIASSAGISLDDITGALASMTVHGMSADQAAQNLADTIKHMVAPTMVQTKELGQLGMSSADLADKLGKKGITGTLQELSELILSHMGPSGRVLLNAFNQSKDAANDANIMISKMPKALQDLAHSYQSGSINLTEWREALKGLPPEQANLLSQFASLQNRASGFNDILKSGSPAAQTYQDALRRVTGDATGLNVALMLTGENTSYVNGAVKTVSQATSEAGGNVKGWSEIQSTFNQKMSEAKASLGALGITVGQVLLPAFSKFVGWLSDGAKWMEKHPGIAKALAIAVIALAVAFTIAAVAVWMMNAAFLANPVFWIVAAIVVVIIGLIILIYELVKHWKTVWGAIWDLMKAIGHWFAHDFAGFFVAAWDWIKGAWETAHNWVMDKINALIGFVMGLPGRIRSAASSMWDGIKDAFRAVVNWVIDRWNGLKFTIPAVDFLGFHTPSFTLAVPSIPKLAEGGFFPSTPGGTLGILGEAGVSEYALPEPKLAALLDQAIGRAGGGGGSPVQVYVYLDGRQLKDTQIRVAQRNKLRNGNSQMT